MSMVLPLSVGLAERAPPCIIDAHLALAPGGLLFAVRLSRAVPVWLTRRFWTLVDGAHFYQRYPEELSSALPGDGDPAKTLDALSMWHAAWLNGALDGAFYWIGDARRESALPKTYTGEDVNRYERIAGSLAARAAPAKDAMPPGALTACSFEAVALAATLSAETPFVLTTAPRGEKDSPALCKGAAGLQGIETRRFPRPPALLDGIPASVRGLLETSALAGMRIAAVHVFAPGALTVPAAPAEEDGVDSGRDEPPVERDPWADAKLLWHIIS
jgi:hypothetical protein